MVKSKETDHVERKPKLSEGVRDALLAHIRDGSLSPGDPLPSEREMMRRFGVGRPSIREAMQSLETAGLVDIRHGDRARVAEPSLGRMADRIGDTIRHLLINSPADLENLKDARVLIETEHARLAARRRSRADVARLARIVEAQDAAEADPARFVTLDGEFHREVATIAGNPLLTALTEAVFTWLSEFHPRSVRVPGLERLTLDEHRAIVTAIDGGRAGDAARAMHDHLARANALYHSAHAAGRSAKG